MCAYIQFSKPVLSESTKSFCYHVREQSYDRLVTPDQLVTWGPYRFVQHPIYTSYICLFTGYCLMLRSPRAAALLAAVCVLYYSQRTAVESQILEAAFGVQYKQYAKRTARFIPFLL